MEGFNKWKRAQELGLSYENCRGTWNWCTGVGKTYGSCLVINSMLAKNDAATATVMVPGPDLKRQWKEEIKTHVTERFWKNVTIYTVGEILQFIQRGERIISTLFIADELHEYYTDERLKIFNGVNIMAKGWLGLTATYYDIHGRHRAMESILPIVDAITEEEALREGYISEYLEYNLAVSLTEKEQEAYDKLSSIISKNLSFFGREGLDLASRVLQGDKGGTGMTYACQLASMHGWRQGMDYMNPAHREILDLWSPQKVIGYAKLVMDGVRERTKLLYFCQSKLKVAVEVVTKFDKLKTICFSQSTFFADALGRVINQYYESLGQEKQAVVFHSQLDTIIVKDEQTGKESKKGKIKLKKEAIEAFATGRRRIMSTASTLDKGLDIRDIRLELTTSGTQNPTQYSQRKGRVLRKEEDIIVLVVNLYVRDTMDERWLRKRQSKSNNIVYWVDKVDDISYESPSNQVDNDLKV